MGSTVELVIQEEKFDLALAVTAKAINGVIDSQLHQIVFKGELDRELHDNKTQDEERKPIMQATFIRNKSRITTFIYSVLDLESEVFVSATGCFSFLSVKSGDDWDLDPNSIVQSPHSITFQKGGDDGLARISMIQNETSAAIMKTVQNALEEKGVPVKLS